MSDRTETYDVDPNPHITLSLHRGDVRIKEGTDGRVVVRLSGSSDAVSGIEIDAGPDAIAVRATGKKRRWASGTANATVTIPTGSAVTVHLGAGDINIGLAVSELETHTGSGDIRTESVAGTSEIKVGSGDIRMGSLGGTSRISSAAGDIRIDGATEITIGTAAGDVYLGDVTESARIKSATGDIRIRKFSGTDLEMKTMSGDAIIGLVGGMTVNAAIKTLSGDFRNRIKPSTGERVGTMNLSVTSFSGDVILKSAR